jgi:hypothetical protein
MLAIIVEIVYYYIFLPKIISIILFSFVILYINIAYAFDKL